MPVKAVWALFQRRSFQRAAPTPNGSAYRYLHDCISIFEEWGWSWAYHAWREWEGWSVEHGGDRSDTQPVTGPTDRLLLLKKAFRKAKP